MIPRAAHTPSSATRQRGGGVPTPRVTRGNPSLAQWVGSFRTSGMSPARVSVHPQRLITTRGRALRAPPLDLVMERIDFGHKSYQVSETPITAV